MSATDSVLVLACCLLFSMASVDTFWELCHKITKHTMDGSISLGYRKFRAFFGTSPIVCVVVWDMLLVHRPPKSTPEHLLWALLPTPFNAKWWSHKFNGPGLRYEIALCIRTGEIVWANGGLPCGEWPDLRLARNAFIGRLQLGEKALADGGYRDQQFFEFTNRDRQKKESWLDTKL